MTADSKAASAIGWMLTAAAQVPITFGVVTLSFTSNVQADKTLVILVLNGFNNWNSAADPTSDAMYFAYATALYDTATSVCILILGYCLNTPKQFHH